MEKYLITDKNLLKFINESDIQKIAELFSFGRFAEIIDNYFRKEKNDKNEPVKLIDDFFVIENLKKNNISNNNKEKNTGNENNKKENNFDLDINTFYSNSSNNLRINKKIDFTLNMLDRSNTNTINNIDNKNNEQYLGSIGIIEDYYNDVNVDKELDLKLAALAVGEKNIEMVKSKDLLDLTGYIHGGCSPIGMKKYFATTIDESALNYNQIYFSAGKVGLQVKMNVQDIDKVIKVNFKKII